MSGVIAALLNDRYRIDKELGQGGMGMIYRAHDTLLGRDVAVKLLSDANLSAESRTRLLGEAQAAAKLNHPRIVSVYDAGEAVLSKEAGPAVPFIVMELVEGTSLHESRPQSLDEVLSIARQVCEALAHAHKQGVVHRDIKPENILITTDGAVKLTDFGLARSVTSHITADGPIVGTVFYLAPELALGQPFDGRADLYALGVVLYELVTGRLPFTGDDLLAVISQHLHAPVVPPRSFREDLPAALEQVILKLLAKNPEERFATAADVVTELVEIKTARTVLDLSAVPSASDLDQLVRGRLVGRRAELKQLLDLWAHVQEGHGRLGLISGEPGIGKTRLAHEVMVYAQLNGAAVLRGGCYEYEATMPYIPFVEALREWVHKQEEVALRGQLGSTAPELVKLAPEIESKLGPVEPNPPLPANEERLRLFDSVTRFLHDLTDGRGLLLFIDDLHWADQGTLALLHYLLRNLRTDRLLVLAAYREVELDRTHPLASALVEWNRERLATRVSLGRLTREDTEALLSALLEDESVPSEFSSAIYTETEGNPFFVEEVVKALIEQGQLYRVENHWACRSITDLAIPQSVKEAIGRRLNRIDERYVSVLHTAAALGKLFSFSDLVAVSDVEREHLLNGLDEASAAHLIRLHSGEVFVFTHDKIREVLYEELNPIRRRLLHQRIGEGLETLYASTLDDHAQDLAYHFIESGDLEKGLRYALRAAEQAQRVFAQDEAVSYYESAAECAEALALTEQQVDIYEAVGDLYYGQGLIQQAVEAYQRGLALATAPERRAKLKTGIGATYGYIGDERGLEFLHAALEELNPETQQNELAVATAMLGRFHHYQGERALAIQFLERARELAEPLDDPDTLTEIYVYLAGAYQRQDVESLDHSIEWAHRSISLGERKNYPHAIAMGYEFLAEAAINLGRWREALDYAALDREIGERIGSQARMAWSESACSHAYYGLGDLGAARAAAEKTIQIAERIGDDRLAILARMRRVFVLADVGEDEMALENARLAVAQADELKQRQMRRWSYIALGYVYQQQGKWERLLELADFFAAQFGGERINWIVEAYLAQGRWDQVVPLMEEDRVASDELPPQAQARRWRLVGRVRAAQEAYEEALSLLDQAVATFEELDARLELGRTLYHRGQVRHGIGDSDGARADWTWAVELLDKCGARPDVERARQAIRDLAV